jgi:hypothetical protein
MGGADWVGAGWSGEVWDGGWLAVWSGPSESREEEASALALTWNCGVGSSGSERVAIVGVCECRTAEQKMRAAQTGTGKEKRRPGKITFRMYPYQLFNKTRRGREKTQQTHSKDIVSRTQPIADRRIHTAQGFLLSKCVLSLPESAIGFHLHLFL